MMLTLIKNGDIYTPEYIGRQDILVGAGTVIAVQPEINVPSGVPGLAEIDAKDNKILPGFIDSHVHIAGGGEGGPASRTPEISLSQLTTAGITTVVGLLGFDGVTRSMPELLAKARALDEEGLTAYIYTGAYEIPTRTVTGNVRSDLVLIDKIIGVGEIAIADHRSAQPTLEMLTKLTSEARIGGMLGNKAGIVHIHVGEGKQGLSLLFDMVRNTDIPITQLVPTHVNRLARVFQEAIRFLKMGGTVDLTAGISPETDSADSVEIQRCLQLLAEEKIDLARVTASSDGNGSLPRFDTSGNLTGYTVGSVKVLWEDIRAAVKNNILPLPAAVSLITRNPARILRLPHKGAVAVGNDADLVFLDGDLKIDKVMSRGRLVVDNGIPVVKGHFE